MSSKPQFVGEKVKLGELISKAKVERCGDRSFPVYSMTMHDGIVEQSGRFKKTIASRDTSSYKVVKKNQLVVGFPIDEGVIYVQNHDQPGIMSPAYNVWDFDSDRILPAYLEFVLHSPQSMAYYAEKMRGTTARRRTLTGDALKNMPVPVPSIEDQYAVVKTLNCIKSQLAATQQMLDKLDQLVKSRFVEMFGDPALNPMKWDIGTIESYCDNLDSRRVPITQGNRIDGPYPYIGASGVVDHVANYLFDETLLLISEDGANLLARTSPIAFTISGKAWVNNHAHVLRCRDDETRVYLQTLINMLDISLYVSGSAQPKLSQKQMNRIPIMLPSRKLLVEFAAFAVRVDKSRFIAQQQIEKLQMLYDSLAQDYFGD